MRTAVYFGSRELYADMISASKSLLNNSNVEKIYLLIEDDEYPYPLPESGIIEPINVMGLIAELFDPNSPNMRSQWTPIGLIRAALTKVFPDLDKVLTIDCDTLVLEDVSDLWDIPIDDVYFAAVQEPVLSRMAHMNYVNAGVMMLNLKKLRENGIDEKMIHELNTRACGFVAQDVLNKFCQEGIRLISNEYNACAYTGMITQRKILHFAGVRRIWRDFESVKQWRELPWESVRTT